MPAFLVELPPACGLTLKNNIDSMIVFATDAADAKAMAQSLIDGDNDALWAGATVTQVIAAADMEGWRLRVAILNAATPIDITVVGAAAATIDTIAALMVTALNATVIDGAAYSAGNLLTVAAIADNLGDKTLTVQFLPPAATHPGAKPIPGLVGAIVHQGIAGAVLTAQLAIDAYVIPKVLRGLKQT